MIECIVRLPDRIPCGYTLSSSQIISSLNGIHVTSGRSIRTVPLIFYKVFSQYGHNRYEHVFVTDEAIEDDSYKAKMTSKHGIVLYPVSIKKMTPSSTNTYLFSKSINTLLTYYTGHNQLAEISGVHPVATGASMVIAPQDPSVTTYTDFQCSVFGILPQQLMEQHEMKHSIFLRYSTLTWENPWHINACIADILGNITTHNRGSILDIYMYEHGCGFDVLEFLDDYLYDEWIPDPITLKCILSPFITLGDLVPQFDNHTMTQYQHINYVPMHHSLPNDCIILNFNDNINQPKLYEIVTALIDIPDTDFTLEITDDVVIPTYTPMFGYPCTYYNTQLEQLCRVTFMMPVVGGGRYNRVIISKNWMDEVYIHCEGVGMTSVTYYIHLGWFHMISPSLVNNELFTILNA